MKYNTTTLPNGLRIIHLPAPGQQVLYCGYAIAAGTRHELPGEEGLAHLTEHTTFKGTERRTALQILNELERVGGDLNAFTTKEHTVYYAAVLHEHALRAIRLLSDIVFSSTYPQAEVQKEIEVVCDEIESYNDSPSELIFDEFENLLFPAHPLGHNILGDSEQLHRYTSADILRFARRHYRPDNMVFFAYGDVPFERLLKAVENKERPAKDEECPAVSPPRSTATETALSGFPAEKNQHHQAHVMLGTRTFAADDERRMTLFLLNNILGGPGMNARLNLALRERRGLVYTVESNMTTYSDTGTWAIYFGCDHEDVKHCLKLVNNQLQRVARKPLSQRQLAAAKTQLKGQLAIASDNREQFALDFARTYLHEGREYHLSELFSRIDAVTAEGMQQLASELFAPERLQLLVM